MKFRTFFGGAGNEIRTRDTKLGKLVLYQLSYARLPMHLYKATERGCQQQLASLGKPLVAAQYWQYVASATHGL
jgi:hypothetical protein